MKKISHTEESITMTKDVTFEGMPLFILGRYAIQYSSTLDECLDILSKSPRTNGYHYIVCDGKDKSSAAFDCSAHHYAIRIPQNGLLYGVELPVNEKHYKDGKLPHPDIPITDDSSVCRYERLKKLVNENYGNIDVPLVKKFFSDKVSPKTGKEEGDLNCICNNTTLHSVVYVPSTGELHIAQGKLPAPDGGYVATNIFSL